MGIEFMLRENPPKTFWRGKTSSDNLRFPVKTNLAGKNVRGQHEITRQSPLRLLKKYLK
jgi:hypothetical protein